MEPESSFRELLRRVRAGDAQAADELVRQFESAVRRAHPPAPDRPPLLPPAARPRLGGHLAIGPGQLLRARRPGPVRPGDPAATLSGSWCTMAHNKLVDQARKAANRRPLLSGAMLPDTIVDGGDRPERSRGRRGTDPGVLAPPVRRGAAPGRAARRRPGLGRGRGRVGRQPARPCASNWSGPSAAWSASSDWQGDSDA